MERLPEQIYLRSQNDPDDLIWDRIPVYRTHVFPAPPVHQSVGLRFDDGAMRGKHLYFQVARTSERFYVRLHWKDPTENRTSTVDAFSDGVAVQYALNGADTSYMMGSGPEKPVNIWYWRADLASVENLAAGGFGSTTTLPEQSVSSASAYVASADSRGQRVAGGDVPAAEARQPPMKSTSPAWCRSPSPSGRAATASATATSASPTPGFCSIAALKAPSANVAFHRRSW